MGIRLRGDVYFSDPESRIREYCEIEVYEGYDDRHTVNNLITRADIESANTLYAMIDRYDKNESQRILAQSQRISAHLKKIPRTAIYEYSDQEWAKLKAEITALLRRMTSIYRVGVAKSTKILHLKRPMLFPVLDSYVVQFLTGKMLSSSSRDIDVSIKCMDYARDLIKTQIIEFTDLQRRLADLPINLTIVRLFDILCWSTHKWDILGKTTAPRGRAVKSFINIQKPSTPESRKTSRKKQIMRTRKSSALNTVIGFFNELTERAKYGILGEKPLAVLAALQYLKNTGQIGVKFLDLLDYPYYEKVRLIFIELAEQYGNLARPSSSWSVITGTSMELQNAINDNGRVNQAVADLSQKEIDEIYMLLYEKYH